MATDSDNQKVAWGITGAGDRLRETVAVMKNIKERDPDLVVEVFLSKAGNHVLRQYKLADKIKSNFDRVMVEIDANKPFLSGWLQTGRYKFLLVAPATANTVAKVAYGIADTMLTNSIIMSLKRQVPVYIMPTDYRMDAVTTKLPTGKEMKLQMREEDVQNAKKLRTIKGITVIETPKAIIDIFTKELVPRKQRSMRTAKPC